MPKITAKTEAKRILSAVQATRLMMQGQTKESACAAVGISVFVYNSWIAQGKDAIVALQNALVESERVQLTDLANMKSYLLAYLVKLITSDSISSVKDILDVLRYIDDQSKILQDKTGVNTDIDRSSEYAKKVLRGPQTQVMKSQMSVTINANPDGSATLTLPSGSDIIDLSFPETPNQA